MSLNSPNRPLRLLVNLSLIQQNYKNLCAWTHTPIGAVLKADAYGLGAPAIAKALFEVGCRQFFLATLQEALEIRQVLPTATLYVLHGCFPGEEPYFLQENLIPVLNNPDQLLAWKKVAVEKEQRLPAIFHFDTGMNRLGFDAHHLPLSIEAASSFSIAYIMSHLACADDPKNPYNTQQRERFLTLAQNFPSIPRSLAASEGIGLGPSYHFDLLRIGIALYGLIPYAPHVRFAIRPQAQIIQTRLLKAGETIGYGQRYTATGPKRIGVIAMGFADGLHVVGTNRTHVYIGDHIVPTIGRISMDLTMIDLSHLPESIAHPMVWVDLFKDNMSHLRLAQESQSGPYEITCRIGRRYQKIYTDGYEEG